jgi:hypothetical protein
MNRPLEFARKTLARFAADKARGQLPQVLEYPPEEDLSHVSRSDFVCVGKVVAGGRARAPDAGERARIQVQSITDVVESDAMSQLRVTQTDNMTPWAKGSGLFVDFGFSGYLGNSEFRNEVANLAQQIHFRSRWNVVVFYFHPCRVAGLNAMFQLFLKILWDGCEMHSNKTTKRHPHQATYHR